MESDKPIPQANNKLTAAQSLLDRVGVSKTETLDINHQVSGGIFLMPDKAPIEVEAEEVEYEETRYSEEETGSEQPYVEEASEREEEE